MRPLGEPDWPAKRLPIFRRMTYTFTLVTHISALGSHWVGDTRIHLRAETQTGPASAT